MNFSNRSSVSISSLLFLVLSVVVFPLYIYHNPARWEALYYNFPAFFLVFKPYIYVSHAVDFLLLLVIALIGRGLGVFVIRWARGKEDQNTLPSISISIAVGWGVLAYLLFALTILQALNPYTIAALLSILLLLSLRITAEDLKNLLQCRKWFRSKWGETSLDTRAAFVLITVPVLFAFFSSLMPPTQSDGLRYHLTVPKLYLDHGGFVFFTQSRVLEFSVFNRVFVCHPTGLWINLRP